eukprot:CAMPEP_0184488690 /NCGR_PEP_ID=MMETSP0113_2-20130426/13089_1 /TAXON_ID=91329 /ORGANISM="Norrisiella sphaerica, Strain BC52" /LENGTH=140 /DNA_ID=CAMNT_0026871651 /DNA_START=673 /DNA_END=1095 /DNA_ORIENTATION=+
MTEGVSHTPFLVHHSMDRKVANQPAHLPPKRDVEERGHHQEPDITAIRLRKLDRGYERVNERTMVHEDHRRASILSAAHSFTRLLQSHSLLLLTRGFVVHRPSLSPVYSHPRRENDGCTEDLDCYLVAQALRFGSCVLWA